MTGGWTNYGNASRKFHFTTDPQGEGRSLCGRWMRNVFARGELNIDGLASDPPSRDDCAACRRKLEKLLAKEAAA